MRGLAADRQAQVREMMPRRRRVVGRRKAPLGRLEGFSPSSGFRLIYPLVVGEVPSLPVTARIGRAFFRQTLIPIPELKSRHMAGFLPSLGPYVHGSDAPSFR